MTRGYPWPWSTHNAAHVLGGKSSFILRRYLHIILMCANKYLNNMWCDEWVSERQNNCMRGREWGRKRRKKSEGSGGVWNVPGWIKSVKKVWVALGGGGKMKEWEISEVLVAGVGCCEVEGRKCKGSSGKCGQEWCMAEESYLDPMAMSGICLLNNCFPSPLMWLSFASHIRIFIKKKVFSMCGGSASEN